MISKQIWNKLEVINQIFDVFKSQSLDNMYNLSKNLNNMPHKERVLLDKYLDDKLEAQENLKQFWIDINTELKMYNSLNLDKKLTMENLFDYNYIKLEDNLFNSYEISAEKLNNSNNSNNDNNFNNSNNDNNSNNSNNDNNYNLISNNLNEEYSIDKIQEEIIPIKKIKKLKVPKIKIKKPKIIKIKKIDNRKLGKRKKYNMRSPNKKQEIINFYLKHKDIDLTESKYSSSKNNLKRWLNKGIFNKKKTGRKLWDQKMEDTLISYWNNYKKNNLNNPNHKLICKIAKQNSSFSFFNASQGWLNKFLNRNPQFK